MTTAPASTTMGASLRLISPLTEMKAMSTPSKEASVVSSTTSSWPRTTMHLPAERWEASSFTDSTGKPRWSRILRNSVPTAPVAPTTAILGLSTLVSYAEFTRPQDNTTFPCIWAVGDQVSGYPGLSAAALPISRIAGHYITLGVL